MGMIYLLFSITESLSMFHSLPHECDVKFKGKRAWRLEQVRMDRKDCNSLLNIFFFQIVYNIQSTKYDSWFIIIFENFYLFMWRFRSKLEKGKVCHTKNYFLYNILNYGYGLDCPFSDYALNFHCPKQV